MDLEKYLDDSYEIITGEGLYKINGGNLVPGGANGGTFEQTQYGNQAYVAPKNENTGGSATSKSDGGDKGSGNTQTEQQSKTSTKTPTPTSQSQAPVGQDLSKQGYPSSSVGDTNGYKSTPKDPTLKYKVAFAIDKERAGSMGHGIYVHIGKDIFTIFEVIGLSPKEEIGVLKKDEYYTSQVLSNSKIASPSERVLKMFNKDTYSGVKQYMFESEDKLYDFLKQSGTKGFDKIKWFMVSEGQSELLYNTAVECAKNFYGYKLIGNSCGKWASDVLTVSGSGIHADIPLENIPYTITNLLFSNVPNLMIHTLDSTYQPIVKEKLK